MSIAGLSLETSKSEVSVSGGPALPLALEDLLHMVL